MSEAEQISCPSCGQVYSVPAEQRAQYQGATINCTKCGKPFVAALSAVGATPPAAPPPVPPPAIAHAQGAGPVEYGGYAAQRPTLGNGLAVTSLIFGIVGFCLPIVGGVVAIITGILGINRTRDPRVSGRGLAIAGLVLGCVSMLASLIIIPMQVAILLPALNRAREQANRVKCASNMRQLGMAFQLYANNHGGQFPDKLEEVLLADNSLTPAVFVCPDDSKTPPDASSTQTMAAGIGSGQHTSYIYLGKGVTTSDPPDTVLLMEPLSEHRNQGMNVVYADGHVAFLRRSAAQAIASRQAAGVTHIRQPDTSAP